MICQTFHSRIQFFSTVDVVHLTGGGGPCSPATDVQVAQAASASPLVVTFPNPNIFLSPHKWRVPGDGTIWAPIGGPYLKFSVTGTTQITANIDATINEGLPYATDYPSLKVIIDGKPAAFVQFTQ